MEESRTYYFAYGSNCNTKQMAYRYPKAKDLGAVTLHDYALEFRHYATIRQHNGKMVKGVLWELTKECEKNLDRYEGFPSHYKKDFVTVELENGNTCNAMVYIMVTAKDRGISKPSDIYYNGIRDGLTEHNQGYLLLYEALEESIENEGRLTIPKPRSGRKLKLTEERTTIRTYIDNSTLEAVDEYVHQRKKEEKGYSRSDCINKALADFLAKEKEEESNE